MKEMLDYQNNKGNVMIERDKGDKTNKSPPIIHGMQNNKDVNLTNKIIEI